MSTTPILNIGLDVSKDTIDVAIPKFKRNEVVGYQSKRISNNLKGYALLEKDIRKQEQAGFEVKVIAETTGIYSFPVMDYCSQKQIHCNEVHAFAIAHFTFGEGYKNKTDKADAKAIADYAYALPKKVKRPYVARTPELQELAMLMALYKQIDKVDKGIKGVGHAYDFLEDKVTFDFTNATKALDFTRKKHAKETKEFHKSLTKYCKDKFEESYEYLESIPGVGDKLIPFLLNYTHNFTRFDTSREFTSYLGVVPNQKTSGTSVKYRAKIADKKSCNSTLRAKLSQSAGTIVNGRASKNKQVTALVNRLRDRPFKQKLIAASRKLATQIHYIGTNKVLYDAKA